MKKVEKLNEKGGSADERFWKPAVDKTETVMQLFDSSLHLRDVIFHGHNCGVTLSKVLADGTLRIPLPLWVNRILSLNTIVFFGTVGWMQTKRYCS